MSSLRVGHGSLPARGPRLLSAPSPSRHLPSPASRWPRLRTPGRAGASLPRSHLVQPRRALEKGGQGEVRAVPLTLVTGSGRAPRGREPEEEEWDGRGRGHAQGGRTARGARAGGAVCLLPICAVGRADGVEGPATPSPACGAGARASRLGSASALRRGAPRGRSGPLPRGPGRPRAAPGGAAEGPRGARSGFPAAFPCPHRRAGVRAGGVCVFRGGWGGERHSEFPVTFPACGKGALHGGARTEGRND